MARTRSRITPLVIVTVLGHLLIVERLIVAGADVDKATTTAQNGSATLQAAQAFSFTLWLRSIGDTSLLAPLLASWRRMSHRTARRAQL